MIFFLITYTFIEKTLLVNASKLCSCLAFLFLIQKVLVYSYNPRRALEKPRALHGVDTVVVVYYLNWKKKKKVKMKTCPLLRSQARRSSVLPVSRGLEWASGHL